MRVFNKTDHGVFVADHGVVPAQEEATVPKSDQVAELIKSGALREVKSSSGSSRTTNDQKDGDGS